MVQRNCVAPIRLCHHFAGPMRRTGRGSIVLVSSGAGLVGGPNMVAYGATKAFDMVMTEALWAEMNGTGVDVLGLVLGLTDTPALRRLLSSAASSSRPTTPSRVRRPAEQVVAEALANLSNGPTCFAGEDVRLGEATFRAMSRNEAVRMLTTVAGGVMGRRQGVADVTLVSIGRCAKTSPTSWSDTRRGSTAATGRRSAVASPRTARRTTATSASGTAPMRSRPGCARCTIRVATPCTASPTRWWSRTSEASRRAVTSM